MARVHIVAWDLDANGNVLGRTHENPILDTRMCQVEFIGRKVTELTTDVIAESMYAQCDTDSNVYLPLDSLIDHHEDDKVISLTDQHNSVKDKPVTQESTAGWKIYCQWKGGSISWEKLSELKESHPVQTDEFAVAQWIDHNSDFNQWVKHMPRKRDRIVVSIRKQQTRYLKKSHKFVIKLPKTVKQALALDAKNDNTLWADATCKEEKNVKVAFEVLLDGKKAPSGHQLCNTTCYSISKWRIADIRLGLWQEAT